MGNPAMFNANDFVRVTNEGDTVLEGRYAGIDYEFPIGQSADISLFAAHHIFGFGGDEEAKMKAFSRHGWIATHADIKEAKRKLSKIRFEEIPNVIELVPKNRISRMGPQADGGTEGATAATQVQLVAPEDPLDYDEDEEDAVKGERI